MLVVVPVSSMKTSWAGSSPGCSSRQRWRAAATSGRVCSEACAVFFKADAAPIEEPPNRGNRRPETAILLQPYAYLIQRQVRCLCHLLQQPVPVVLDRARAPVAALTAGLQPGFSPPSL